MADNAFSVRVPNALEGLMAGEQGYKEQRTSAVREQAAQSIMNGGDPKNALAQLLQIGDDKGAATLASVIHQKSQQEFQQQQLGQQAQQFGVTSAETARHSRVMEGQAAATLAETRRQRDLAELQPVKIGTDPFGADIFARRNPKTGGYERIDVSQFKPAPPDNAPVAAPPAGSPGPQPLSPATSTAPPSGDSYLQSIDPGQAALVKKVANYEIDPRTFSTKGGHRERILSAVAQFDPTYDMNTFPARSKAVKDFSTGTQGNAVRSFDVALDHIETTQELARALKNGDVNAINSVTNKVKSQFGYEGPVNFDAAKSIVGAEIAKAIVGGQFALQDREELRASLNSARSPEQLDGVINTFKKLMAGQLKGLKKQYEDTTGRKDFDGRLRDNTKKLLSDGGSSAVSGTTPSGVTWSVGQ